MNSDVGRVTSPLWVRVIIMMDFKFLPSLYFALPGTILSIQQEPQGGAEAETMLIAFHHLTTNPCPSAYSDSPSDLFPDSLFSYFRTGGKVRNDVSPSVGGTIHRDPCDLWPEKPWRQKFSKQGKLEGNGHCPCKPLWGRLDLLGVLVRGSVYHLKHTADAVN